MPRLIVFTLICLLTLAGTAAAQFKDDVDKGGKDNGGNDKDGGKSGSRVSLGEEKTQKIQVGVIIKALGGPCGGLRGTVPFPIEWPEQQVKIIDESISPHVKQVHYRTIGGTVKQMLVEIPRLPSGETATALITLEVRRRTILPPDKTDDFVIPAKPRGEVQTYLSPSPLIESANAKIKAKAKEIIAGKQRDWDKVEAIYDFVRGHVKYINGPIKGALKAYDDKTGDCEELTSLFIAMCRANGVPARTVWVPGHCYPEFYLEDKEGKGHWFPCQAAGDRAFGGIPEQRPILQKGDNFKDPDRPRDKLRYVSGFLKVNAIRGGQPDVKFICQENPVE